NRVSIVVMLNVKRWSCSPLRIRHSQQVVLRARILLQRAAKRELIGHRARIPEGKLRLPGTYPELLFLVLTVVVPRLSWNVEIQPRRVSAWQPRMSSNSN